MIYFSPGETLPVSAADTAGVKPAVKPIFTQNIIALCMEKAEYFLYNKQGRP